MARFLFVIWDGDGSVPPMIGVAQEVQARSAGARCTHGVGAVHNADGSVRAPAGGNAATDGPPQSPPHAGGVLTLCL
jgi:hypothetical protein